MTQTKQERKKEVLIKCNKKLDNVFRKWKIAKSIVDKGLAYDKNKIDLEYQKLCKEIDEGK